MVLSGFFFTALVVGVASSGVDSFAVAVEHAKIRRDRMSIHNFSAILKAGLNYMGVRGRAVLPQTHVGSMPGLVGLKYAQSRDIGQDRPRGIYERIQYVGPFSETPVLAPQERRDTTPRISG